MKETADPWARVVILLAVAATARCGGKTRSEPAGRVTATPAMVRVLYPQSVPLSIAWEPLRPLDGRRGRAIAFVHLVRTDERKNEIFRTFDHFLPKPWIPGETQTDEIDLYQSALAEALAPGRYVLSVGLYDEATGYRWPLASGPEIARREYRLAEVEVGGPDPTAPALDFSGGWQPAEKLPTRQVLERRPFVGASRLSVQSQAAGSLRLLVTVPPKGGPETVRLAPCSASSEGETVPAGKSRWFSVDVAPGGCTIDLEPSLPGGPTSPVPASLDVVAWRPLSALPAGAATARPTP
jgi:hypothetical protein